MMSRALRVKLYSEKMNRIPREEYQANGSDTEQTQRKRIKHCTVRKEGLFPYQCSGCYITTAINQHLNSPFPATMKNSLKIKTSQSLSL